MTKPGNIADVARLMLDDEEVMGLDAQKRPWQDVASCIPQGFSLEENGLYRKTNKGDEQVSGAVWVSAKTRDPQSEEWGIALNGLIHMVNGINKLFPVTCYTTRGELR